MTAVEMKKESKRKRKRKENGVGEAKNACVEEGVSLFLAHSATD